MVRWFSILGGCVAVAAAASFAPGAVADDGPDDRIRRLEEALERQAAAMEGLRRDFDAYRREHPPGVAPTDDEIRAAVGAYLASSGAAELRLDAAAPPHGLRFGGYFHWRFQDGSEDASYFDQHRVVLTADADITRCIDFEMELEIEHGGVSDEIEGEVVLEKAEVQAHLSDLFNPKVGWLLVPFGRYNLYHDDPINDLTNRPFTARYLVPTGFGQPGIGADGAAPFGCGHVFSYDVAVTNGYRDAFDAENGVRDARQAEDENEGKQVWGRLAVTWETGVLDHLETGLSGTYGLYDADDDEAITGFALDLLARKGPFELKAEYVAYHYERDAGAPPDAVEGQSALWLEAAWHFFPCAWRSCRSCLVEDTSLFTLVARWQTMDLDDDVTGASFNDDLSAWTAGLNYRVNERTVFRVDHTWYDAARDEDRTEWTVSVSTFF